MKVKLHLRGDEKLEVMIPDGDKFKPQIVHNLTFDVSTDGQDAATFAGPPAGLLHVCNVAEAVAAALQVGADYVLTPA